MSKRASFGGLADAVRLTTAPLGGGVLRCAGVLLPTAPEPIETQGNHDEFEDVQDDPTQVQRRIIDWGLSSLC
jgi:hypothetical protein